MSANFLSDIQGKQGSENGLPSKGCRITVQKQSIENPLKKSTQSQMLHLPQIQTLRCSCNSYRRDLCKFLLIRRKIRNNPENTNCFHVSSAATTQQIERLENGLRRQLLRTSRESLASDTAPERTNSCSKPRWWFTA